MMEAVNEISGKLSLLRSLAASHGVDALLLQRVSSVAWATSGPAVYVNTASSNGEASLLVTPKGKSFLRIISKPRAWKKMKACSRRVGSFRIAPWFETNACFSGIDP